ncbi:MAG: UbiA family prenyltransferase [Schleiferiaceae bacterium]
MKKLSQSRLQVVKVLALLSQIRWYNIALLLLGQYLIAIFVFAPEDGRLDTLYDSNTHCIAWAGAFIMAFGFLINSFYDQQADSINRPMQSAFERLVSKRTSLNTATLTLVIGLLLAWSVSITAAIFFGSFAVGLWYHSHRLRNIPIVSHTSAAILALTPFFGMSVYHNYSSLHTFAYGALLGLTLFSRELLKDLLMLKGDILSGRRTVASEYGEESTRNTLIVSAMIAWIPAFFTRDLFNEYAATGIFVILVLLSTANFIALKAKNLHGLRWAHLTYKVILILGILTLPFL